MMELQSSNSFIQQYFEPVENREGKASFFYRFLGYDDFFLSFLSHYLSETKKAGVYIRETLPNPTEEELRFFTQMLEDGFVFNAGGRKRAVERWFAPLNALQQKYVREALEQPLALLAQAGFSEDILKNLFIKLLCWMKFYFIDILFALPFYGTPKILYQGFLGKYQLVLLKIFQALGCDIAVIDFAGEPPCALKLPDCFRVEVVELPQKGRPTVDFTKIDWELIQREGDFRRRMEQDAGLVVTNSWAEPAQLLDNLLKPVESRQLGNGLTCNLFCEYRGAADREVYEGTLYELVQKMEKYKKPYCIVEKKLHNPTMDETGVYREVDRGSVYRLLCTLTEHFSFYQSESLNRLGRSAFYQLLCRVDQTNTSQLFNLGVTMLCWLSRYRETIFQYDGRGQLPLFLFYGCCRGKNEPLFLSLLAGLPVDVLVVCPDLSEKSELEDERLSVLAFPHSLPVTEFPRSDVRIAAGTAAYRAERELDSILYSDTGMYKAKQFREARPVNLKTTYDEIGILWHEPAKFRPYFQTNEQGVVVPNILAKISGVKDRNKQEYIEEIRKKITKDTILIKKVPYLTGNEPNPMKEQVAQLVKDKKLLVREIKTHKQYLYDYLPEEVQDFILAKIQALIDEDLIESAGGGIEYTIAAVLLNLDKNTLRHIQNFDFTCGIPKLIMIDTDENMCSLEDCIYVMFLSLVGFDVLIYSPPGYRVIDKYLKNNILKEYIIGEYVFDMALPAIAREGREPRGLIEKIFGKGKG